MISNIKLLTIPGHVLSNRQFAIGNLDQFKVAEITNVKHANTVIQQIQIPWNTQISGANMVCANGKYYDIVSIDDMTYIDRAIILTLLLNPVSTYIPSSGNLTGYWERVPTIPARPSMINIRDDTYKESRRIYLDGNMPKDANGRQILYYQITTKENIETADKANLTIYAGFAEYTPAALTAPGSWGLKGSSDGFYPTINQMISGIDIVTSLTPTSILDVSMSLRSPWKYSPNPYKVYNANDAIVSGLRVGNNLLWELIKIDGNDIQPYQPDPISQTISLSQEERYCGKISLVDDYGNLIASIPNDYFDSENKLTFSHRTISDIGNIYTMIDINKNIYSFPCGKLPWIGSEWANYVAGSLVQDREAMARNVDTVYKQRDIDMINSVAGGMMTTAVGAVTNPAGAALGVAQMGLGLLTSDMQASVTRNNIYSEQKENEGRIKNSPSSNYQTGYGLDYAYRSYANGAAHIKIEMPSRHDDTGSDFANYINYRGWPCNYYGETIIAMGHIKGTLTAGNLSGPTPEIDALRREISIGCNIIPW